MNDQEMLDVLQSMIEEIIKENRYKTDEVALKRVGALRKAHYILSHLDENRDVYTVESIKKLEDME